MGISENSVDVQIQNVINGNHVIISVVDDFCRFPGGRFHSDGPGNGTKFREEHLLPILKEHKKATIDLDDAAGYPASFLDEAFGGLVYRNGYTAEEILEAFDFKASHFEYEMIIPIIVEYIVNAKSSENQKNE